MIERNAEGRPLSARELRRTAKCCALIDLWWSAIPESERQPYYRGWVIVEATGQSIENLAPALRQLGWRRSQYRQHRGEPRLYWVPPGYPNPVRPVGRPPGRPESRILPSTRAAPEPT